MNKSHLSWRSTSYFTFLLLLSLSSTTVEATSFSKGWKALLTVVVTYTTLCSGYNNSTLEVAGDEVRILGYSTIEGIMEEKAPVMNETEREKARELFDLLLLRLDSSSQLISSNLRVMTLPGESSALSKIDEIDDLTPAIIEDVGEKIFNRPVFVLPMILLVGCLASIKWEIFAKKRDGRSRRARWALWWRLSGEECCGYYLDCRNSIKRGACFRSCNIDIPLHCHAVSNFVDEHIRDCNCFQGGINAISLGYDKSSLCCKESFNDCLSSCKAKSNGNSQESETAIYI